MSYPCQLYNYNNVSDQVIEVQKVNCYREIADYLNRHSDCRNGVSYCCGPQGATGPVGPQGATGATGSMSLNNASFASAAESIASGNLLSFRELFINGTDIALISPTQIGLAWGHMYLVTYMVSGIVGISQNFTVTPNMDGEPIAGASSTSATNAVSDFTTASGSFLLNATSAQQIITFPLTASAPATTVLSANFSIVQIH